MDPLRGAAQPRLDEQPDVWRSEGNAKLTSGDNAGAYDCFSQGIQAAVEARIGGKLLGQLYSSRAQALVRLGRHTEALADCEAAVDSDPSNGKAYWRGASAALKAGRPEDAASLCRRGLAAVGDSQGLQALLEEATGLLAQSLPSAPSDGPPPEDDQDRLPALFSKNPGPGVLQGGTGVKIQDIADRGVSLLARYRSSAPADRDEDDAVRARRLFETCLRQDSDNETSLIGLGDIYEDGLGVERNPKLAGQLWTKALECGSAKAHMRLCMQALNMWALVARTTALDGRDAPQPT